MATKGRWGEERHNNMRDMETYELCIIHEYITHQMIPEKNKTTLTIMNTTIIIILTYFPLFIVCNCNSLQCSSLSI